MQEQTSLVRAFDSNDNELVSEYGATAADKFFIPDRNWNGLIDSYNSANKRKFPLTAVECKSIIEYVKKDVPPQVIFKALGVSPAKYKVLQAEAYEYEDKLQELNAKESLTDEEFTTFHIMLRNPLRVLMCDIERAQGIADIVSWEKFNQNAETYPDVNFAKMKAKFKDFFSDKDTQAAGGNVTIFLGGNFIESI